METWIECFRAGTHEDSEGEAKSYTKDDLDRIASLYNEAQAANPDGSVAAPIVKGHPADNAPAYGWVKELKRDDDLLLALVNPVKDFAEEVNQGLFKKVSISLYDDLMLRHIGFLGGTPPAVKGLKPVSFSEKKAFWNYSYSNIGTDEPYDEFFNTFKEKISNYLEIPIDKLTKNQLTDYIVDKLARNTTETNNEFSTNNGNPMSTLDYLNALIADVVAKVSARVSPEEGSSLQADFDAYISANPLPSDSGDTSASPEFNEPDAPTTPSAPTSGTTIDPIVLELKAQIAELEKVNRVTAFNEKVEKLVREGKLLPKQVPLAVGAMEFAHNSKSVMNFSENGKAKSLTGTEAIMTLLDSYPNINNLTKDFSEGRQNNSPKPTENKFNLPDVNKEVNEDAAELHRKITFYQEAQSKAGRTLTFTQALNEYRRKNII